MAYVRRGCPLAPWHGRCTTGGVTSQTPTRVAPAAAVPSPTARLHQRTLDLLAARGVDLEPLPGESVELFEARLETALMACFRDRPCEETFEALHGFASPELCLTVRRCVSSSGPGLDPAEVLQDVFVNIYRYAGSFRDERPRAFRAWSSVIARNVVRRKLGRRSRLSLEDLPEGLGEPADPSRGPVLRLCCEEERHSITEAWQLVLLRYLAAYEELSPRDQQALDLVEVEGRSYADAAAVLGVGLSNMKMILFRARKRIRARICASFGLALAGGEEERLAS